jgi:hypothetical protein
MQLCILPEIIFRLSIFDATIDLVAWIGVNPWPSLPPGSVDPGVSGSRRNMIQRLSLEAALRALDRLILPDDQWERISLHHWVTTLRAVRQDAIIICS